MSDNTQKDRTALYGCLGTVLAATISGVFLLLSTVLRPDSGGNRNDNILATPTIVATSVVQIPSVEATPSVSSIATPPTSVADSTPTEVPSGEATLVVGQPMERDGVSLSVNQIEVNTESGRSAAAAQVSFRLLNKTGRTLVVPIDWSNLYIEDSLGNRYVDYYNGGSESVSIEPQTSRDFERYYSLRPRENSVVPPEAEYIEWVVGNLSKISGARWRYSLNADLAPIPTPDPSTVKGELESWEQDDIKLTVNKVEIYVDRGSSSAALKVEYVLRNNSSQRRLVEIDFSQIYAMDSFGRRYGDYYGAGLEAMWLEPGEPVGFERYYSLMVRTQSTFPTNSDFALIIVEKLGPIENKQWRIDIVR